MLDDWLLLYPPQVKHRPPHDGSKVPQHENVDGFPLAPLSIPKCYRWTLCKVTRMSQPQALSNTEELHLCAVLMALQTFSRVVRSAFDNLANSSMVNDCISQT